ncbi:DUF6527 family protein [Hoeflea poritis]|uniref:DUF6527 family protein n=1 Tax=Hoeflea poritis TaxID=2993659 RepID=A0ABT4VV74_9HYPH|nr:DUF6527 family protein [Hoeflea poritis]MDA4848622.1 DUF6527 family protein [Hoeflea poritis]
MTRSIERLTPRFVEFIPKALEPGVLYISVEYTTTAHSCACGCGEKVVLPLHPTDWCLTFDGKSITMRPSVGNWGFPCRSHYLITGSQIEWASDWSEEQIAAGRTRDAKRRSSWHKGNRAKEPKAVEPIRDTRGNNGLIQRLVAFVTWFWR